MKAPLNRARQLLERKQWQALVEELDSVESAPWTGPGRWEVARGLITAMRAEALENLGRIEQAAKVLTSYDPEDIDAPVLYLAGFVLRHNLAELYEIAARGLRAALSRRVSGWLADLLAREPEALLRELELRLSVEKQ